MDPLGIIQIWLVSGLSFWIWNEIYEFFVVLKSHEYFGKRRAFRIGTKDLKNLILCLIAGPFPILYWLTLQITKGFERIDFTIFRIRFPKTKENKFERETKEKQ